VGDPGRNATNPTEYWKKTHWEEIAYISDAKYCNSSILKTADFPAYSATVITDIDSSVGSGGNTE
jgi:hypothetical protein